MSTVVSLVSAPVATATAAIAVVPLVPLLAPLTTATAALPLVPALAPAVTPAATAAAVTEAGARDAGCVGFDGWRKSTPQQDYSLRTHRTFTWALTSARIAGRYMGARIAGR